MLKLIKLGLIAAVLAGAALAWYAFTLPQAAVSYPLGFSVPRGASFKTAARELARVGAVEHPLAFEILARALGRTQAIKAGSYALDTPMAPLALLRKLTAGETVLGKVTVIEGWRFADMRRAIAALPNLRHDSAGMSDADLLKAIGASVTHAEGQFFPDTYFFDTGSSDLALYKRAHHVLRDSLEQAWAARAPGLPYRNPEEALTMASIIEKETGVPEERARIAAVFINRTRIGMRLQTDPTVIYGLGSRYAGNLRRVDLERDTPYNTYTRAGLPPTPIALVGLEAIEAALHPEDVRALYFVANGNGRHVFSNSLDDHNRAVARYQKGR